MQMHLDNGEKRTVRVSGLTYGFRVTGVTLDFEDVRNLLNMEDGELRDYLGVLFTRFAPPGSPQPAQQEPVDWEAVAADQAMTIAMMKAEQEAAVLAEREACAQVCDDRDMGDCNREDMEARACAAAIRARKD